MSLRRPPPSVVLFLVLVFGVVLWFASGLWPEPAPPPAETAERQPVGVATVSSAAAPVERLLTLYGDVEPSQRVLVRAETSGRVAEVATSVGSAVESGDELLRIALGDRDARLRRAQAQYAHAEREYDTARQLVERGTAPEIRLRTAEADLAAAQAEIDAIQVDIDNTVVQAPIGGVVNQLLAETGDYLAIGGEAIELVDNDPLTAVVHVPQHAIHRVRQGGPARVSLIGAEPVEGRIAAVAVLADAATRTFRVEIAIPNEDGVLPAGLSAEVELPTDTVLAHRISPAVVTLDDRGRYGVFTVEADETVAFQPIQVVRAEADGIWVAGLPEQIRLVTTRPGFLSAGQPVTARALDDPPADE